MLPKEFLFELGSEEVLLTGDPFGDLCELLEGEFVLEEAGESLVEVVVVFDSLEFELEGFKKVGVLINFLLSFLSLELES